MVASHRTNVESTLLSDFCGTEVDRSSESALEHVLSLNELGISFARTDRPREAIQSFTAALELLCPSVAETTWPRPHFFQGQIYRPSKRRKLNDLTLVTLPNKDVEACHTAEYDEGMNVFPCCLSIDTAEVTTALAKATVLMNLATAHVALKQFEIAMTCFKLSLETAHKDDGSALATRPHIASCLHGMGNLYFKCGRIDDSHQCYKAALDVCDKDDNQGIHSAAVLNCLGVSQFHRRHRYAVDTTEALFRRALTIQRTILGPHPDASIATTLNNLGRVLCVEGRMEEALQAYFEAFAARVRALGGDHLDVAATAYNIGQTLQQMRNLERALEYYENFMFIATNKLGRSHIDVILALKCMAQIHQDYRRFDKALELYNGALEAAKQSVGQQTEVASILNKIGNIYFEKGNLDKAMDSYEEGLQVECKYLDRNHPNIGVTLSNLGLILHRKGDLPTARMRYKEALQVQMKCYEKLDIRIAKTWSHIGHIEFAMRDYTMALESHQQALRVRRHNASGDDLEVAATLNSVGLALFKLGINELALRTFSECLRIRRNVLGPRARDVAVPMFNMATTYHAMGSDDDALRLFRKVHSIELEYDDRDVEYTLLSLAQLYEARGNHECAVSCYEEILERLNEDDAKHESTIVRTLTAIANLHLRCGETKQALDRACEAIRAGRRHGKDIMDIRLSGFFLFDLSKICTKAATAA